MLTEDLVVFLFVDLDIMVLSLKGLIVLSQDFLIILKFHDKSFVLLIFLIELLVGLLLLVKLVFYALEFAVKLLEIVLVKGSLVLDLFLEFVGFFIKCSLKMVNDVALLLKVIIEVDDLLFESVYVSVTGFELFL